MPVSFFLPPNAQAEENMNIAGTEPDPDRKTSSHSILWLKSI